MENVKVLNQFSRLELANVTTEKMNTHLQQMNSKGWELMSVAIEMLNADQHFLMFWRKLVPSNE